MKNIWLSASLFLCLVSCNREIATDTEPDVQPMPTTTEAPEADPTAHPRSPIEEEPDQAENPALTMTERADEFSNLFVPLADEILEEAIRLRDVEFPTEECGEFELLIRDAISRWEPKALKEQTDKFFKDALLLASACQQKKAESFHIFRVSMLMNLVETDNLLGEYETSHRFDWVDAQTMGQWMEGGGIGPGHESLEDD